VAAVTAGRRSLLGKTAAYVVARQRTRSGAGRLAAVVARAREHVMTFAALASADIGAFHWGAGVGWLVTGASILALDFAVSG
jgi:hypothetical protein